MDQIDKSLFEHKFTSDMNFRSSFEKIKCFRVIDEEGEVITPGFADKISDDKLMRIYDSMITMNEADVVYNQAQRQARISFYMT